jgi:hypothetical protein
MSETLGLIFNTAEKKRKKTEGKKVNKPTSIGKDVNAS